MLIWEECSNNSQIQAIDETMESQGFLIRKNVCSKKISKRIKGIKLPIKATIQVGPRGLVQRGNKGE